ncbi:MAG: recombinase RecT [Clostridium butyricum]|uniref:recombinase RecT n=1 Tax=Clostridium TaxID=1485 RepID=UPI00051C1B89|nr:MULTISPECIES: recombinase RecT [Clostridium]MDU1115305.1 recombinase RecT [Clostridium sp.]MDU7711241.1 recombinase RecT [Clostridium butyricum]QUF81977.1 recombinase RecT [Clostridium butyricum]
MANVHGGLINNNQPQAAARTTVKGLMCQVDVKKRFEDILGKKAPGFISSVINVAKSPSLADAEPNSIMASAVVAATLDLPIDPNLGFAYIVPYNDKKQGKIAQFQMGYKGFIQLAMRSGQYKTINAAPVFENDLKKINRLTGEIEFNDNPEPSTKIVGYVGYFRLINGFEKALYMTREELEIHGKKYSQSYKSNKDWVVKQSLWTTDFDSMATKTVLKLLLSKYGPMSIEMQTAIKSDQASFNKDVINGDIDGNINYPDNQPNEHYNAVDTEFTEVDKQNIENNKSSDKSESEEKDIFEGTPFADE